MFIVFDRDISLILQTREISLHKNNSHDLHIVIIHSFVRVLLCHTMACFFVISYIQISIGYYPCRALIFVDIYVP